jgi:hypothetical protein
VRLIQARWVNSDRKCELPVGYDLVAVAFAAENDPLLIAFSLHTGASYLYCAAQVSPVSRAVMRRSVQVQIRFASASGKRAEADITNANHGAVRLDEVSAGWWANERNLIHSLQS